MTAYNHTIRIKNEPKLTNNSDLEQRVKEKKEARQHVLQRVWSNRRKYLQALKKS